MSDALSALRYVILRHAFAASDARQSHWDWMFREGDHLATWTTAALPVGGSVAAHRIADHRIAYLDYEGPVRGERGEVHRVDGGTFAICAWEPRRVKLDLYGTVWSGELTLQRRAGEGWLLSFSQSRNESA